MTRDTRTQRSRIGGIDVGRGAPSFASTLATRERMQSQSRRDTGPELALRRALHARGMRYRVDVPPIASLRRRADVVFPRQKIAVFVDGCFWHACPQHSRSAKSNAAFWSEKLARNAARDTETDECLTARGWCVIRVWEHEPPETAAHRIADVVAGRRSENITTP